MYYKEAWIDGKLMYKTTPNGEWKEFSLAQYRDRLLLVMIQNGDK